VVGNGNVGSFVDVDRRDGVPDIASAVFPASAAAATLLARLGCRDALRAAPA
jgi:hypothetical protein